MILCTGERRLSLELALPVHVRRGSTSNDRPYLSQSATYFASSDTAQIFVPAVRNSPSKRVAIITIHETNIELVVRKRKGRNVEYVRRNCRSGCLSTHIVAGLLIGDHFLWKNHFFLCIAPASALQTRCRLSFESLTNLGHFRRCFCSTSSKEGIQRDVG
jgi:hypothetical protein